MNKHLTSESPLVSALCVLGLILTLLLIPIVKDHTTLFQHLDGAGVKSEVKPW